MYKNPGFNPSLQEEHQHEDDFVLGSKLPSEVLVENGDWRPYYPKLEVQRNNHFDTYSCVSFANCNASEMMHKVRYGEDMDYSDRFMSVISNTRPGVGNSHKNVAETRRKKGSVLEEVYPFTMDMTQAEFFQSVPSDVKEKGLTWVEETEYGYEKVRRNEFKEALKLSPIQVAVDSRTNKTSNFRGADHSVVLTHIDGNEVPYIFDSYLNRYETYDIDYPFSYGLRFHYKKIITLNYDSMSLELIKGDKKPEIYLLDYDGNKHHIDAPFTLEDLFGASAWYKYITKPQAEVDSMPEGIKVSTKSHNLIEGLKRLIQSFGKKK